jgi:hypothetical protein
MGKPAELYYHGVDLPGRSSVREPMPPPVIRLVRGGKLVQVKMNEAQLLDLILNATRTLDLMRKCRGATVPEPELVEVAEAANDLRASGNHQCIAAPACGDCPSCRVDAALSKAKHAGKLAWGS